MTKGIEGKRFENFKWFFNILVKTTKLLFKYKELATKAIQEPT